MILKETVYLPRDPRGLFGVGGTYDDQVIRVRKRVCDGVAQITRYRQLVLVTKYYAYPFNNRFLTYPMWYMKTLQPFVDRLRNPVILGSVLV